MELSIEHCKGLCIFPNWSAYAAAPPFPRKEKRTHMHKSRHPNLQKWHFNSRSPSENFHKYSSHSCLKDHIEIVTTSSQDVAICPADKLVSSPWQPAHGTPQHTCFQCSTKCTLCRGLGFCTLHTHRIKMLQTIVDHRGQTRAGSVPSPYVQHTSCLWQPVKLHFRFLFR